MDFENLTALDDFIAELGLTEAVAALEAQDVSVE